VRSSGEGRRAGGSWLLHYDFWWGAEVLVVFVVAIVVRIRDRV